MPALAPVSGVIRFRFLHTIGAEVNTGYHMYFNTGAPPTQAQLDSAVSAAATAWDANMRALSHTSVTLTSIVGLDLSAATAPISTTNPQHAGTRTGTQLPASSCVIQNFHIARRYRGGKPRVYVPAGSNTDLATPQTWTGAFLTAFASGFGAFGGAIATNLRTWAPNTALCSVSYYAGGVWKPDHNGNYHRVPTPRPVPVVDNVLTQDTRAIVGSQRRRLTQ